MPVSLSVIATKDSAGTAVAGGLQAQDKSGAGTGPFTLGHVLIDGLAGTLMAAVTAGNALKVDGSAVTQPVSLTSTTITGTVAATQSGTWTVQPGNTANTTAWKVDGSAVTQPVSGTLTANMGTVTADPFGANADAASATGSISAKLRFIAATGIPITGTVTVGSHAVTQSGTWTVQPGNTANTTAWKVDGSAVTQPVSGTLTGVTTVSTVTNLATIASVAPAFGDGVKGATVLRTTLATDSAGIITVGTAGSASTQVVTMQGIASMTPILATTTPAASEIHVGEVGGKTVLFPVTLSLDTNIYASGDVLADTQIMDGFFRKTDGTGIIHSIQIIDQDDQKSAFDIYFLTVNQTMGTENSAPSISDANAIEVVGPFSVATSDYKDLGGVSVAKIANIGQSVKAVTGTDDLYVAVVNGTGTPTYTASGIKLRVGGLLD